MDGVPPAIRTRLRRIERLSELTPNDFHLSRQTGLPGDRAVIAEIHRLCIFALDRFCAEAECLTEQLREFLGDTWKCQPCLRDIWHDHVLYTNETVTGLVDYGSMKMDVKATDLARLGGSLCGDSQRDWQVFLEGYRQWQGVEAREEQLISVLDRANRVLSPLSWAIWLFVDGREFDDYQAIWRRIESFLALHP